MWFRSRALRACGQLLDQGWALQRRLYIGLLVALAAAALSFGLDSADGPARSQTRAAPDEAARPPTAKPPPIPEAGPSAEPKSPDQVGLPTELMRQAIPPDNPQTPDKIALGEKLFFDRRLSANGTVACSTCHDPARAFTDRRPTSVGVNGRVGQRNAMTILNALFCKTQFWDGRAKTLEDQAALPIVNPIEMGQPSMHAAVSRIAALEEYQQAFRRVFSRPPNARDLVRAIAFYERTQVSFDSPFDHFIAGDSNAIDDSAKRGWELLNTKARCNKCHGHRQVNKIRKRRG
jgi:cytochrome c peroxidase